MKWVGRKLYVTSTRVYERCFPKKFPWMEEDLKGWEAMRIRTSWLAIADSLGIWPWNEVR